MAKNRLAEIKAAEAAKQQEAQALAAEAAKAEAQNEANELIAQYKAAQDRKKAEMEILTDLGGKLQALADSNPEWFDGCNTKNFKSGKLAIQNESKFATKADFDWNTFLDTYPEAVKFSLKAEKMKVFMENDTIGDELKAMGVTYEVTTKLVVK